PLRFAGYRNAGCVPGHRPPRQSSAHSWHQWRSPGSGLRAKGKSKLDPYLDYLRQRWNAGEHSGSRLFAEIKQRGYTGSESLLRSLLGEWRTELPPKRRQGPPRKPRLSSQPRKRRLSSRGAAFLMILSPSKLSE